MRKGGDNNGYQESLRFCNVRGQLNGGDALLTALLQKTPLVDKKRLEKLQCQEFAPQSQRNRRKTDRSKTASSTH